MKQECRSGCFVTSNGMTISAFQYHVLEEAILFFVKEKQKSEEMKEAAFTTVVSVNFLSGFSRVREVLFEITPSPSASARISGIIVDVLNDMKRRGVIVFYDDLCSVKFLPPENACEPSIEYDAVEVNKRIDKACDELKAAGAAMLKATEDPDGPLVGRLKKPVIKMPHSRSERSITPVEEYVSKLNMMAPGSFNVPSLFDIGYERGMAEGYNRALSVVAGINKEFNIARVLDEEVSKS